MTTAGPAYIIQRQVTRAMFFGLRPGLLLGFGGGGKLGFLNLSGERLKGF